MWDMRQVLALGCGMGCSLISLRGVGGCHGDGPILLPPSPVWMGLFLCSCVLDSHYAGRRVTGCRHWQNRSSPRAKNTGVECECISTAFWRFPLFTTVGSCSWVCQGADTLASLLGAGQQALVMDLSTKYQQTWPWWCRPPSPWQHCCGGAEGWAGHTWLQASHWAGPPSCDG